MGQATEKGGRLKFLLYWSGPLTESQSQWHPFEQEMYGLLELKRAAVKHLGRIPMVLHTHMTEIWRTLMQKEDKFFLPKNTRSCILQSRLFLAIRVGPAHQRWIWPMVKV